MAILACPDCKKEFSESIASCPKCHWTRKKEKSIFSFTTLLTILIVIALSIAYFFFDLYSASFDSVLPKGDSDKDLRSSWGALGDFFGGVLNPVLAFISLILLIITLRLNLIELSLTRQELTENRKEMAKSSEALEAQSESLQRQNFESTFFHMIELYNSNVDLLDFYSGAKGKNTFKELVSSIGHAITSSSELKELHVGKQTYATLQNKRMELIKKINSTPKPRRPKISREGTVNKSQNEVASMRTELSRINNEISLKRKQSQKINDKEQLKRLVTDTVELSSLDHYLSSVESLLSYVKDNSSNNVLIDKKFYDALIRSQMSFNETYFLFFVLIANENYQGLKTLCTEASLFKNISSDDLYYGENHLRHYDRKAFGLDGQWD